MIKRERRETAYCLYMSEGIKVLTQNTAHAFGGSELSVSLSSLIEDKPVENRTADEVIKHMKEVIRKAGES